MKVCVKLGQLCSLTSDACSGRGEASHKVTEFGISINSVSDFGRESSWFSGDKSVVSELGLG